MFSNDIFISQMVKEIKCRHVCVCVFISVPLQAWSGPEGSRKLRFPDFMTTAQRDGKIEVKQSR